MKWNFRSRPRTGPVILVALGVLLLAVFWFRRLERSNEHKHSRVRYVSLPGLPGAYLITNQQELEFLRPLQAIRWLPAAEARDVKPDDIVLGLRSQGRAWAVPFWIMKNHHVANAMAADQPVMMTFCERCSGGAAFNPVLDGRRYTFRVVGVYKGTHLLSDDESGSRWAPFSGKAVLGPLEGKRLERLPLNQCTWSQWLAEHPDSFVADGTGESRSGHGMAYKPGNADEMDARSAFVQSLPHPDGRLRPNELVLGVELDGRAKAYPLPLHDEIGAVINDSLGGSDIVIIHRPGTLMTTALSRRLGSDVLSFESENGRIVDRQHRSFWSFDGDAYAGALAGSKLTLVPSRVEEWGAWAAAHPEAEIFRASSPSTPPPPH